MHISLLEVPRSLKVKTLFLFLTLVNQAFPKYICLQIPFFYIVSFNIQRNWNPLKHALGKSPFLPVRNSNKMCQYFGEVSIWCYKYFLFYSLSTIWRRGRGRFIFEMPACVSWAAEDRKRDIVFLLGVGISKRRNKNWAGGSGGCGINKRMEVQMDQLSSPL